MSSELFGKRLSARRASILNDAGRSRATTTRACSTAIAVIASRSAFASTWRATDRDTRPKTRVSARGGLVGVVFRQPHQQPTVGLLDAGARQIGQRGAHVVGEHALERAAVPALQEQLAVAAEDDALHGCGVLPERARGVDEGGDRPSASPFGVRRENEKRSTAVRSSIPIAFSVGLGPAVRDAQAEPADASTPRASSACSSGSAGRPGNASDAMWGARGAPVTVGRTPGTTPASAVTAACSKQSRRAGDLVLYAVLHGRARQAGGDAETDQGGQVFAAAAQAPLLAAADPQRRDPGARAQPQRAGARGPCSLCAERATLSAPSARGRRRDRPNACTASTCKWGAAGACGPRWPQQARDVGDGLHGCRARCSPASPPRRRYRGARPRRRPRR